VNCRVLDERLTLPSKIVPAATCRPPTTAIAM
jgi:hypothetical protein